MLKFFLFVFGSIYFPIAEGIKASREFLSRNIKFDPHTLFGVLFAVGYWMILSGHTDLFADFTKGISLPEQSISRHEGAVLIPGLAGIAILLFVENMLVYLGYVLILLQWLIMLSFEHPEKITLAFL